MNEVKEAAVAADVAAVLSGHKRTSGGHHRKSGSVL